VPTVANEVDPSWTVAEVVWDGRRLSLRQGAGVTFLYPPFTHVEVVEPSSLS